jgi:hypothetical protein
VKLIYFDEAKNQPDYPYYHIGGVCIDEANLADVETRIGAIAVKAFGHSVLSRETELHATDIYHRKRNFKDCPDFGLRLGLISEFAEILSLDLVKLIDIQINCSLLHESQSPEEIAFMFLCERANDLVRAHRSLGMLIGDRENDDISHRFSTTLSSYRAGGTEFAFGREIGNLVDSVHFTHSHLSRFLQLADVYTWLLQFRNRHQGSNNGRHKTVFEILSRGDVSLFPAKYKKWPKEK